jgi:uncharacterized protein (UPF0332 family)
MTIDNQEEYIQYRLKKAEESFDDALLLAKYDRWNSVKSAIIDKEYGKLYSKLFDFRQKGVYGDLFDYDMETVGPLIGSAEVPGS